MSGHDVSAVFAAIRRNAVCARSQLVAFHSGVTVYLRPLRSSRGTVGPARRTSSLPYNRATFTTVPMPCHC